jgi:cytochrome c-type biogenesis protein CcmE
MKGRYLLSVVALLAIIVVFAIYAGYPRLNSTHIANILASPNSYIGKQVALFGTVVERGDNSFTLADGTGSIVVRWGGALPAVGTTHVFVQGVVTGLGAQIGGLSFENVQITATSVNVWPV